MSRNAHLAARDLKVLWHPCTQMKQHAGGALPMIPIARGQGAWLYDFDGRRYLDGISSWWVNLFGHAHPAINAALKDQLDRLEHVMLAGFRADPVAHRLGTPSGRIEIYSDAIAGFGPPLQVGNNFHVSIVAKDKAEADRAFAALSAGGKVNMPLANAPWGPYFGMCVDRFGVQWMVSLTGPA